MENDKKYEKLILRISELEKENFKLRKASESGLAKEEELWSSMETFYKMVTESAITSIIVVDEEENLIFFNPAFSKLTGYSEEELASFNMDRLTTEPEYKRFRKLTLERKKGLRSRYEAVIIDRNGNHRDMIVEASPIINSQGKFLGTNATLIDITAQKENERRLLENERKMTLLFDHAPVGYCLLDLNGQVRHINGAFEKYTGLPEKNIINKTFLELPIFHEEDLPTIRSINNKICKSKSVTGKEFRIKCRESDLKHVEVNCYPIILEGEKMILYALWDITERKIIEEGKAKAFTELENMVKERTKELSHVNRQLENEVEKKKEARDKLVQSYNKLQRILEETVNALTSAVEKRDPYTSGHQESVSLIASEIARLMKLPQDKIEGIRIAGLLHDIGKITVPSEILSKPSKLNEMEFNIIKMHSSQGYDILKGIEFPWPIADIVHQHHERMDGSGYPQGLQGEDILLEARIIGVSDLIEAISSHRPYRPSLGIEKAIEELQKEGARFDSDVVKAALELYEKGILKELLN